MYVSIFNSFRVIRCLSQCVSPKIAILPHFCFPWRRPCDYHAICCMDGKTIQCLSNPRSMYLSIFNSFPVIRTASAKKIAIFTYRSPHYCFPWRRPCDYHAKCCMDRKTRALVLYRRRRRFINHLLTCLQFNACQTPRSMYLSIFNSFRVIRCLSQCVSPKIAIFITFWFPWGRPWGNHAKCCLDGKRIRCLQIVSEHVPIYR